jgi:hypothetical protein
MIERDVWFDLKLKGAQHVLVLRAAGLQGLALEVLDHQERYDGMVRQVREQAQTLATHVFTMSEEHRRQYAILAVAKYMVDLEQIPEPVKGTHISPTIFAQALFTLLGVKSEESLKRQEIKEEEGIAA